MDCHRLTFLLARGGFSTALIDRSLEFFFAITQIEHAVAPELECYKSPLCSSSAAHRNWT